MLTETKKGMASFNVANDVLQEIFNPSYPNGHFNYLETIRSCYDIELKYFHVNDNIDLVLGTDTFLAEAYRKSDRSVDLEVIQRKPNGLISQYLGVKTHGVHRVLCSATLRSNYLNHLLGEVNAAFQVTGGLRSYDDFTFHDIEFIRDKFNEFFSKRYYAFVFSD